jgi:hypothetical protein
MPDLRPMQSITPAPAPTPTPMSVPSAPTPVIQADDMSMYQPTPIATSGTSEVMSEAPQTVDMSMQDDDIDAIARELSQSVEEAESAESPFLASAKVEKRPLGAFSGSDKPLEVAPVQASPAPTTPAPEYPEHPVFDENASSSATDAPQESATPAKTSMITPMPAELSQDVLSVESKEIHEDVQSSLEPTTPSQPQVVAQPSTPTGQLSQQYSEKPSTTEKVNNPIFDTESYHKSAVKNTKKRMEWLWVLWILLLIVVGAGAGAGVYFFVLPK